jgi:probable HAF family extracellular repeat protein
MLVCFTAGVQTVHAQPQYTVHDLGTLGGTQSSGGGGSIGGNINHSGQVAGVSTTANGDQHAFRTGPNAAINPATDDLGTLGGTNSAAVAINSSGQVVGSSTDASGAFHGFRTAPNSPINPATDDIGGTGNTFASGINDAGRVVGTTGFGPFETQPNSPINPATDNLNYFGGVASNATAVGINNAGDVAGTYFASREFIYPTAVLLKGGVVSPLADLGIGGVGAINDSDQVALHLNQTAAFWSGGAVTSIPSTSEGFASAINNAGHVVGGGQFGAAPGNHAFLYSDGVTYDLNNLIPANSGWVLTSANGINDLEQIAGTGTINGQIHAFRLDPVTCTAPTITAISANPSEIWPPDRSMDPVAISYQGSTDCNTTYSLSVTANRGNWAVVDANNVQLQGEQGAIYTVTVTGANASGTTTGSVRVAVQPKRQAAGRVR